MTTWFQRFDVPDGDGPTFAVKNMVDVAGVVTTCGSDALRGLAPARQDAPIVARFRAGGARLAGVTTCEEFGLGATGVNESMGTPTNPRWPDHITGGSSSGSAAAVAAGDVDLAIGTDGGGSCRIPAACCGIAGLKTTPGRWPTAGVSAYPMNLDTPGPLAPDAAGLVAAMRLVEPDFTPVVQPAWRVGRFRPADVDPDVDAAVDAALAAAGMEVVEVDLHTWDAGYAAGAILIIAAAHRELGHLLGADGVGQWAADRLAIGGSVTAAQLREAERDRTRLRRELDDVLATVDVIALPTIPVPVPRVGDDRFTADFQVSRLTLPFNAAGSAAVAVPVGAAHAQRPPASLQLVAAPFDEERVLGAALAVAAAARRDGGP